MIKKLSAGTNSPAVSAGPARPSSQALSRVRVLRLLGRTLAYLFLTLGSLLFLFPLAWTISISLKTDQQLFANPPVVLPFPPAFENYARGWTTYNFTLFLMNTILIVVVAVTGQVLSSALVAYGFARLRGPGRNMLFGLVLATMMLPGQVTIVPSYILYRYLGWLDTFLPLTVPAWLGGSAFFIFLLRQFMLGISTELDDAARIDGAGSFRIFWEIILPLMRPALGAVGIFSFVGHWNDFLWPLIILSSEEKFTLALGLRLFQLRIFAMSAPTRVDIQGLLAVSLLVLIPVIVVFFIAQKQFIQGITFTGMKG